MSSAGYPAYLNRISRVPIFGGHGEGHRDFYAENWKHGGKSIAGATQGVRTRPDTSNPEIERELRQTKI